MAVTSEDVARAAGVSRSTVSQILNGKGRLFADATRDLVLRTASTLNYQPSAAARTLATGSSDIIIALIPNTTFGANLQELFETATAELAKQGLTLVLRFSSDDGASFGRMVSGMKPRAVISLIPFTKTEQKVIDANGVDSYGASATDLFAFDNYVGSVQAAHLHQRGYQRLAFAHLRDSRQDPFGSGREEGVRQYCRQNDLTEPSVVHLGIDLDEALRAFDSLGEAEGLGIACYNDDVATALIAAASARRLRVPQDLAIMGMDHEPIFQITRPRLTTVSYEVSAGGRSLTAIVLAALTGQQPDAAAQHYPRLQVVQGDTT